MKAAYNHKLQATQGEAWSGRELTESMELSRATDERSIRGRGPLVLEAGRLDRHYWSDLWLFRELFAILAWRDLAVRYKQTAIGIAWAIIRPLLTTLVFTVIFGRIAKLPTEGDAPYPVMVFAGMLPWFLFSTILSEVSNSLINNASLVGKVYFPRAIIPVSSAVVAVVEFGINFLMFMGLMAVYQFLPSWKIVFLPFFLGMAFIAGLGPALLMSALNVKYRDFRYIIPFVLQFGLYISPVGFSSSVVPESWRLLYSLNPIVGAIDGFRWCLLGRDSEFFLPGLAVSVLVSMVFLRLGFAYFRRTERTFSDLI
jgi:lipopolysaccharide transport system permease protein